MEKRWNSIKDKRFGKLIIIAVIALSVVVIGGFITFRMQNNKNEEKYKGAVVIEFKDDSFEKAIRKEINKTRGRIYDVDVENLTSLNLSSNGTAQVTAPIPARRTMASASA